MGQVLGEICHSSQTIHKGPSPNLLQFTAKHFALVLLLSLKGR
jgi:hypothetical protein